MSDVPLFEAAGVVLDPVTTKTKRTCRPKLPTPAERAAADRLGGGRRYRGPGPRTRIGPGRDLRPYRKVYPFPFSRNASLLNDAVNKLPVEYDENLDAAFDKEKRRLENHLLRRGIPKQSARECANELLHRAYMTRAQAAWKEM